MAFILDQPFDLGYLYYGPDHEHFLEAKKSAARGYDKLAYVANRLGITDPIYLVLAAGIVQYNAALVMAVGKSWRIEKLKAAVDAAKKKEVEKKDA